MSDGDKKKFEPFVHSYFPPPLSAWQTALSSVSPVHKLALDNQWGYWVPEPRIVVALSTAERRKQHVHNWVRVRIPWLSGIVSTTATHPGPLRASQWREYLGSSDIWIGQLQQQSKRSSYNREVAALFKTILGPVGLQTPVPAKLFDLDVSTDDEEQWVKLCRMIAWELCMVGFRCELRELDRHLVRNGGQDRAALLRNVFPSYHGLLMKDFPTGSHGLGAETAQDRAPYLDAFRLLVFNWPNAPIRLQHLSFTLLTSDAAFASLELELFTFYCQIFFDHAERPPMIPYKLPL